MTGQRVLIVDDNPLNLKLAQVVLVGARFDVRTARDAAEARAAIADFKPQLILMDIQLPDTNGLDLTREIRAAPETRDIVVIALTAYAMRGDEQRARAAGCDSYLTKPVDVKTLPTFLRSYLLS